jgi:acetylornithine deacetylase
MRTENFDSTRDSTADIPNATVIAMIERLIAFPTVSRDSNLGLIEWVRDYLSGLGVRSRLTYDSSGKKANLFATLGEERSGGIILSGHTDVVPVDGQAWSSDPFCAVHKNGNIYGRGTADMKSFLAIALALAPDFVAANSTTPIHLAMSYDEEVGCIGVRSLIADLKDSGIQPHGCIVGEPTEMRPVLAHKGTHRFRCCVRGKEAHSSYAPYGVNAIEYASRVIVRIRDLADHLAQNENNPLFTVPCSTLQTGLVRGGLAPNVIPKDCEFQFEFRTLPGTSADDLIEQIEAYAKTLIPAMQQLEPTASIQFESLARSPGLLMEEAHPLVQLAARLANEKPAGGVSYGTEAGLFQSAGIPTVICGPGSIEQAHKPDEFVSLEQVAKCEKFLISLLTNC